MLANRVTSTVIWMSLVDLSAVPSTLDIGTLFSPFIIRLTLALQLAITWLSAMRFSFTAISRSAYRSVILILLPSKMNSLSSFSSTSYQLRTSMLAASHSSWMRWILLIFSLTMSAKFYLNLSMSITPWRRICTSGLSRFIC